VEWEPKGGPLKREKSPKDLLRKEGRNFMRMGREESGTERSIGSVKGDQEKS